MKIRKADQAKGYERIRGLFWNIIQTGDTYVFYQTCLRQAIQR